MHGRSSKGKVNVTLVQALRLCTGCAAYRRSKGIALPFHHHGTRRGWGGQHHAPAALYPQERPGTHCTRGWLDPRAGLDRCGKSRLPSGFDTRTVQPVASRYTDWATRPSCMVRTLRFRILNKLDVCILLWTSSWNYSILRFPVLVFLLARQSVYYFVLFVLLFSSSITISC